MSNPRTIEGQETITRSQLAEFYKTFSTVKTSLDKHQTRYPTSPPISPLIRLTTRLYSLPVVSQSIPRNVSVPRLKSERCPKGDPVLFAHREIPFHHFANPEPKYSEDRTPERRNTTISRLSTKDKLFSEGQDSPKPVRLTSRLLQTASNFSHSHSLLEDRMLQSSRMMSNGTYEQPSGLVGLPDFTLSNFDSTIVKTFQSNANEKGRIPSFDSVAGRLASLWSNVPNGQANLNDQLTEEEAAKLAAGQMTKYNSFQHLSTLVVPSNQKIDLKAVFARKASGYTAVSKSHVSPRAGCLQRTRLADGNNINSWKKRIREQRTGWATDRTHHSKSEAHSPVASVISDSEYSYAPSKRASRSRPQRQLKSIMDVRRPRKAERNRSCSSERSVRRGTRKRRERREASLVPSRPSVLDFPLYGGYPFLPQNFADVARGQQRRREGPAPGGGNLHRMVMPPGYNYTPPVPAQINGLSPIASRSMLTCNREFQRCYPHVYQGLCKGLIDVNRLISQEVVIPIKEEVSLHQSSIRSRWAVTAAISEHLWKAIHGKFPDPKIAPRLVRKVAEYFYDKIEAGVIEAEDERSLIQWLLRFDVENAVDIRVTTSMIIGLNSVITNIEGAAHVRRKKGNCLSLVTKDHIVIDLDIVIKALFLNGGQLAEIDSDPLFSDCVLAGENRFAHQFLIPQY